MNRHRNRGFSLIEQMAALAISSFAIMGTMKLQSVLHATQLAGKDRAAALSLTNQVIETIRQSGYPPRYDRDLPLLSNDTALDTPVFCDATRARICLRTRTSLLSATPSVTPDAAGLPYADVQVSTRWSVKSETHGIRIASRIAATSMPDAGRLMLGQLPANLPPSAAGANRPAVVQLASTGSGGP